MARAPARSSKPLRRASPAATPSLILSIPPSPPRAPATPRASSAPKKSPTSSAPTSAPPPSTAATTPFTSTPISNSASKMLAASLSGPSSTPILSTIPSSRASATSASTARKLMFQPSLSSSTKKQGNLRTVHRPRLELLSRTLRPPGWRYPRNPKRHLAHQPDVPSQTHPENRALGRKARHRNRPLRFARRRLHHHGAHALRHRFAPPLAHVLRLRHT